MVKTKTLDNKCPHCGGKLDFNPEKGLWKCNYCDSEITLEELKKFNNASNDENNKTKKEEPIDTYDKYMSYNCPDCGAEIITDEQTTATFCVYCGNTAIMKNKLSGQFAPSRIIPFKKKKEDAIKAFQEISKGRPLTPKTFNDEKNIEKIRGIYIPFWFHSFKVSGEITMNANQYEYWQTSTRSYTRTKVYELIRGGTLNFESVPTDGSTRFDDALMNSIQPYNYDELVPYNHAYLSGFLAERYDVESNDTRKLVEPSILEDSKNTLMNTTRKYTIKTIKSNTLKTEDYKVEYALLPVYMVNVKYAGKMYTFAMNGQTGEFIGDIPTDKRKALLLFIAIFSILFMILIGVSYIIYKVGV